MNLFTPAEYTANYASASVGKAKLPLSKLLLLGILSGFLIGFPSLVTNIAVYAMDNGSVVRILSGVLFAFGLGMVVLTGAELFTGNCLMIIGVLDRRITAPGLLRNWGVVLLGNFLGSMLLSWIAARFGWLSAGHGALADFSMGLAQKKMTMPFMDAVMMGVLCNILVTLGVLMSTAGKDGASRILAAWAPVMFFVTCGFNHSIADMTYCMVGLFGKLYHPAQAAAYPLLTWGNYLLGNLIPVTLGNTVGGCAVGALFWFCWLRQPKEK